MVYFVMMTALVAHAYFWGMGLARLVLPPRWRRFWWAFAPGLGWALQSAVVWYGAHTSMPGTQAYAAWSELLPLCLIGVVVARDSAWRFTVPCSNGWCAYGAAIMLIVTLVLVGPMAIAGSELTTSSHGSCDHADYAAGARVFQDFSRDDREGLLGQREVTHVGSTDYFFDFWLRINHFTPSALLAHNGAIFGADFYQLISVSAAGILVLNLPLFFFMARSMMGIRGWWLVGLVAIFGISSLNVYAVHHAALGQLYAAQGIALLTWVLWQAEKAARRGEGLRSYFVMTLAAFWLLAGSYNFILLVCLAPIGCWWLIQYWRYRRADVVSRLIVLTGAALIVCAVMFWGRFNGLIERFSLFEEGNFGWPVPLFFFDGWLGLLRNARLEGWPGGARMLLSVVVAAGYLAGLAAMWTRRRDRSWLAIALVLPVLAGWAMLAWESRVRANASYDAYKIISVFYPGLLIGITCWLCPVTVAGRRWRRVAATGVVAVLVMNSVIAGYFAEKMSSPPLQVDPSIVDLGRLENDGRIRSLNMDIENGWVRLWANAFLLRKPQYFAVPTYEGRRVTAPEGEWDLHDSLLQVRPARAEDFMGFNERFYLIRHEGAPPIEAAWSAGWGREQLWGPERYRWSEGDAQIRLHNRRGQPASVELRLKLKAVVAGRLELACNGTRLGDFPLDGSGQEIAIHSLNLPPGDSMVSMNYMRDSSAPMSRLPKHTGPWALYQCRVEVTQTTP